MRPPERVRLDDRAHGIRIERRRTLEIRRDHVRLPVRPHLRPARVRGVVRDDFELARNVEPVQSGRTGDDDQRHGHYDEEPDHGQFAVRRCSLHAARIPTWPGWPAGPYRTRWYEWLAASYARRPAPYCRLNPASSYHVSRFLGSGCTAGC